jgi:1,4-alpha-glucan branching enzyme
MRSSFVLILHTHLPYVIRHGKWPHGSDWLSEAAAECYMPILDECHRLLADGIVPNITISFSPVVVEQLADDDFPKIFNDYLDEKIASAESDILYFGERPAEREYIPLAEHWVAWYTRTKEEFNGRYRSDLVGAFRELSESGAIALQTAGATHGYFPLLGFDESIGAQLGIARATHTEHFGSAPRGVWMPECAYRPCYDWAPAVRGSVAPRGVRKGIEQLIAEHGIEYTVVDSHLTRGGKPLGIYASRFRSMMEFADGDGRFLPMQDSRSVHDLYRICSTGVPSEGTATIFTRYTDTTLHVWSGSYGYPGNGEYLDFHKKHHNSGHRYWRVTDAAADLAAKGIYHPEYVEGKINENAEHFLRLVEREAVDYMVETGRPATISAPFDTELFGHWWFEGPRFLGAFLRLLARSAIVDAATAPDELDAKDPGVIIQIPEGSWGDGGDHRVWLNPETEWTWPIIHAWEKRFLELLDSRSGSKQEERVLKQMGRENLLLQASDWQFLITTASASDYATERFREHEGNLIMLDALVEHLRNNRPISLAEHEELCRVESVNRIFPNLQLDQWHDDKSRVGAQRVGSPESRV